MYDTNDSERWATLRGRCHGLDKRGSALSQGRIKGPKGANMFSVSHFTPSALSCVLSTQLSFSQ